MNADVAAVAGPGTQQVASIPALVQAAAETWPHQEAVVDPQGGERVSFGDLAELVARAAGFVVRRGLEPGDRVAIWAPNCLDWVVAALGAVAAGGALVPLNTRYKVEEAAWIVRRSGARLTFATPGFLGTDYAAALRGVLPGHDVVALTPQIWAGRAPAGTDSRIRAVGPEQIGDVIFTSGTTGRPKGVMTTHGQSLRVFRTWAEIVGLRPGDRYLVVNPFFHTFGYKAGILACLMTGATIVPQPTFDVAAVARLIAEERISVLPGPPTIYTSLLDRPDLDRGALATLRLAVTGAASIPPSLIERLFTELRLDTVLTAYGLTEATGTVTMCRRGDDPEVIATTSGRAIPDTEVRVVDATGRALPPGEPGEVVVRGYNVMRGYFDDPAATAAAIDADGWLHTGDVGVLDPAGNLRITDRLKDMYVVGGFNAYPAEIEQVLVTHPAVSEAAVIGVPDERLGEVGRAFVVPRPGATAEPEEIIAWCRERMANYKVPRSVVVVGALPRNASGKVLKAELRQRAR